VGARGAERSRDGGRPAEWRRGPAGHGLARVTGTRTTGLPEAIRIAASDAAPEQARLWLRGLLEWSDGPLEDAQLLLSELVTNSLRHAGLAPGDELEIRVRRPPPVLRVMVLDPGVGFVPPDALSLPPPTQATGRGLYIVSRVADRWGVSTGDRTCVWFEIDGPRRRGSYS
jgi:anti-sigma regulatory factor (Ser/Thr protein kinase)